MLAGALFLSVLGLLVGPALVAIGRGRRLGAAAVDGFALGVVPALLLLRLVPHVVEGAGALGIALVLAGFGALWLADRGHDHARPAQATRAAMNLGARLVLPALVLHALSDGAALAMASAGSHAHAHGPGPEHGVGESLAGAVLLHRLPEGLFLTMTFLPRVGWRGTWIRLGAVALGTVLGAGLGQALLRVVPDAFFDGVVALGAGAMLRMSVHSHHPPAANPVARGASAVGFVAGVALAVGLPDPEGLLRRARAHELSLVDSLGPLFVETAPMLLLGVVVAALLPGLLPSGPAGWSAPGEGTLVQALRGVVRALGHPRCATSVDGTAGALLAARVPVATVVAVAVAVPMLEPGGVALCFRLLGTTFGGLVLLAGGVVPVVVAGAVVGVLRGSGLRVGDAGLGARPPRVARPAVGRTTLGGLRGVTTRARETLDHVAPWYIVGLGLAASLEAAFDPGWTASLPRGAGGALLGALVGVPVYFCAHAAAPVAAVLVHKGVAPGAVLAFVLAGAASQRAVLAVLGRALGKRVLAAFVLSLVAAATALGAAADARIGRGSVPEVHALVAHAHHPVEWVVAAVAAVALLVSLVRCGPRRWISELVGR